MNIPKGYKLVPVEPTEEMLSAMWSIMHSHGASTKVCYEAMLAAAPTPPQPIYDEVKERQLFEDTMLVDSEEAGFGEPDLYRDSGGLYRQPYHQAAWGGWIRCAQSRAKAVEVDHE